MNRLLRRLDGRYCGSSSPDCSRTIYSAYQSGQFGSAFPVRASCFPDADVDAGKPATSPGRTVKHPACVDAVRDQLLAHSLNTGDDEEQGLGRAGSGQVQ
jgi:hypothetical protein